jgi:hypothetical protein
MRVPPVRCARRSDGRLQRRESLRENEVAFLELESAIQGLSRIDLTSRSDFS